MAGVLLPVFSIRRETDLGIGDTAGLRGWVDWAAAHEVGFLQLLPVNENGADESPYSSISSVALDPVYLALDGADLPWIGPEDLAAARRRLGDALHAARVDYPRVREVKRHLLELAWARFCETPDPKAAAFARFRSEEAAWLDDYCLFRVLMERHGAGLSWDEWPEECRTPEAARAWAAVARETDSGTHEYRIGYFAFVQWLCFTQWRELRRHADERGVLLMGDLPIGVSWHSCDVFFGRDGFHLDWCGGSPPEGGGQDSFFAQWGQNWGIPLYRWDAMEADGFQWWKERVRRVTGIFRMFRLDHILGFYRMYAFPWRPGRNHEFVGLGGEEAAARNGGRLPRWFLRSDETEEDRAANRADADRRLRAVLEAAGDAVVIAEDLGWVPGYVRPHLEELGVAGYRIPHWDCNEAGHPTPGSLFPENSLATYSTHDHDPVCGIWRGCHAVIRRHHEQPGSVPDWQANGAHHTLRILSEFAGIPAGSGPWPPFTEGVRLRLIKALLDSRSRYALLMVTSLFGLDDRINRPGSVDASNWSFRLPWTLEQIGRDPRLADICRKFTTAISLSRRSPRRG